MASSFQETDSVSSINGNKPSLPPNVSIFSPSAPTAAKALLHGQIFTRLTAGAQTEPAQLLAALKNNQKFDDHETFCLCHQNIILIFDSDAGGKNLQDSHHEHFRAVCLALKDEDISLDVGGCISDVSTVLEAGFQLDDMSGGSVLVIDLMAGDDSSDEDEDESNEIESHHLS